MALTINNFWGAETGGMDEASAFTGASASTTQKHSGAYSYKITTNTEEFDLDPFEAIASGGVKTIIGFWYRTPPVTTVDTVVEGFGTTNLDFSLNLSSSKLNLRDSGDTVVITGTTVLSTATWYFIEIYVERANSGAAELFIDGVSEGTASAKDFNAITGGLQLKFIGSGTAGDSIYIDDIYFQSGAASSADRLGGCEVISYRSSKTGVTPDTGDDLGSGSWLNTQEIPFNTANVGRYTLDAAGAGSVNTDDVGGSSGGGPNTDTNLDGTIPALKGIWYAKRDAGTATSHYGLLGNSGDGTTRTPELGLTSTDTIYTWISELTTIVPTTSEYCKIGFEKSSGGRVFNCRDMLAVILHVPVASVPRDVTTIAELIAVTENAASININVPRVVNCAVELVAVTENDSIVATAVPRAVTSIPELIAITENDSIIATAVPRAVTSIPEVVAVTESDALVNSERNIVTDPEVVAVTENDSIVATAVPRAVTSIPELIAITENDAIINSTRDISTISELIAVIENDATIDASSPLVVNCIPELVSVIENNSAVDFSRLITGVSEVIAVIENDTSVNRGRNIAGISEAIVIIESDATIQKDNSVATIPEFIAVVENSATVSRNRDIISIPESIAAIESNAIINRARNIATDPELIAVIENDATILANVDRLVNCITEIVLVKENIATINSSRNVITTFELIAVIENDSIITKNVNVGALSEQISVTENLTTITLTYNVSGIPEVIHIIESQAVIIRDSIIVRRVIIVS